MIETSMRHQNDYWTFCACVTCQHEVIRADDYTFNCGWCGTSNITPAWLKPSLVDGQLVLEKAEWSYVDLTP